VAAELPNGERKTKTLAVQIQPGRSPMPNCSEMVALLHGLSEGSGTNEGDDEGQYINVYLKAVDVRGVWLQVQRLLSENPEFASAAIVTCQGDSGWDDYLLLHHFNPAEPLDAFSD